MEITPFYRGGFNIISVKRKGALHGRYENTAGTADGSAK